MSKDHNESILRESLEKLEQQQEGKQQEGLQKDGEKGRGKEEEEEEEEEEEGVASREDVEEEEEECKTPTSSDHKIPTIQSCPPTPKKKVRENFHKRKFSELQFFEATRSEEVESFFRSNSESFNFDESRSIKRRCRSA
ncbi:hypothetical protein DITRI_Ditri05aG0048100 [Diplodiscus trichospermus]